MITKLSQNEDFTIVTKGGGRISVPNVVAEPQFNPTSAYAKDTKVWYGSTSYICTSATTVPEEGHSNPTPEEDSAHWSALTAEEMAKKSEVDTLIPLLFAQYYPDGSVKSTAEFTPNIKYGSFDDVHRTVSVLPFCNTGIATNDNSSLVGRVVIPPFVDANGNGYITDDGTKYKVVGLSSGAPSADNTNPTAIIAPNTVTAIGDYAFASCTSLTSVSLPAATRIEDWAFPFCTSLASIDFGDTPRLSVPALGLNVFFGVPTSCKIIVPYTQYDAWVAADGWKDLPQEFVRHAEKADKPATFTTGNLAALDANGNPTDSGVKASDKLDSTSVAPAFSTSATYSVGEHVTHEGRLYGCSEAVTASGAWDSSKWTDDDMTSPDATLDVTPNGQLRLVSANGEQLWAQGYDLATESSSSLRCDRVNLFAFEATTASAFSDSATYSVGERVAYSGKVYACTTAVATAGAWTGSVNWDEDPDMQSFEMPTTANGKVGDFIVDIDNTANAVETAAMLEGLDSEFSVVVRKGNTVFDLLTFAPGELSELYFTQTAFRVNDLPTWKLVKNVVEDGGAE